MPARCDRTDLLVDQCAHCLGHDEPERINPADLLTPQFRIFTAQYDGRCAVDARHAINVGDRIASTDHGWVCTACMQAALPF